MAIELVKEAIRRVLFPFLPDEMFAEYGTWKFRFLNWLYGEEELNGN